MRYSNVPEERERTRARIEVEEVVEEQEEAELMLSYDCLYDRKIDQRERV